LAGSSHPRFLFWLVILSYLPGMLVIMLVVNRVRDDVPEHMLAYLSVAWLAAFLLASSYRRRFRCPRCHELFFRGLTGFDLHTQVCLHCDLPRWSASGIVASGGKGVLDDSERPDRFIPTQAPGEYW
jgi:hypothetical protein